MKKNDIILVVVVLLLGIISYGAMNWFGKDEGNVLKVVIKHKGSVLKEYDFNNKTKETFTLNTDGELNVVQIENGTVVISEANCNDLICVKTGEISKPGEIIVCLPHKFTVEIVSNENLSQLDDIAE